jgi:hypothetical protein
MPLDLNGAPEQAPEHAAEEQLYAPERFVNIKYNSAAYTSIPPNENCQHRRVSLARARTARNGAIHYCRQCLDCGEAHSGSINKVAALQETFGNPEPFDDELRKTCRESIRAKQTLSRQEERETHRAWYADYLRSNEWKIRRRKVLARCKSICEGCGEQPVSDIHHLTYAHVGNELLFELVGLCRFCHEIVHDVGGPDDDC